MSNRVWLVLVLCAIAFVASPLLAVTSLGTGTAALIGGDRTDPENDINDNVTANPPYYGTGYNFINAVATSELYFTPGDPVQGEGALDVFDNKVGEGETKWCCDGAPQRLAVQFATPFILTTFTIAAGNDVPERDPDVWRIEGSNDGVNWTPIFSYDNDGVSPFNQRLEVLRYDVGTDFPPPQPYSWYRYAVDSTVVDGEHQINEIELFGVDPVPALGPKELAALAALLALTGVFALGARS